MRRQPCLTFLTSLIPPPRLILLTIQLPTYPSQRLLHAVAPPPCCTFAAAANLSRPIASRLPPCSAAAALQRVVDKAQKDFSLTFQLGFELEFYLLRPHKQADGSGSGSGGNSGGSGSSRGGLPPPIDTSNYCHSGALDAAAAGACGLGGGRKT